MSHILLVQFIGEHFIMHADTYCVFICIVCDFVSFFLRINIVSN